MVIRTSRVPVTVGCLQIALRTNATAQTSDQKRFATVDEISPELDPLFQRQMLHTWWSELA